MPIFNVFTRKFSQFVPQGVDDVVGLTGGANSIGPGGGGASITYTFTQAAAVVPPLYLGAAVRVDVASSLWECCLATDALHAEFYGFIIAIVGTTYTVQFAGPVPAGTPLLTGLIDGTPYYLSDTVAGGISAVPPAVTGEVNLPVLWAMDNGNSVIKMSRGFIEGSGGGGGGGGSPNNIATITQAISFALGDVLYLAADQTFAKAHARTFAASQAEWMVVGIVTPGSVYTIQQGGQVQGLVSTDDSGLGITSGPIYYVSPIVGKEGKLTPNNPTAAGLFSKPFYVQQVLSSNTGWLLDQRPVNAFTANPNASPNIFLGYLDAGNGFSDTTILTRNGTFNAYQLIFVGNFSVAGGAPSALGLQPYIGGVFGAGNFSHYTDGVSSVGGVNTATFFGYVGNSAPRIVNYLNLFPPISTNFLWANSTGTIILDGNSIVFNYDADVSDFSVVPTVGYSYQGSDGGAGAAPPTGLRMFVDGIGVLTTTVGAHVAVYGIPNS